ncbi:MAG: ATP-binding protein [Desulfobacterales bacterium]|uniref:ATP-binding protein n=1 Tax=Candidatus Desulfatibia profunda TaxID=2841695 RepID=A0A8J6NJX1_9BACT|nr:ATP-binding protein [Candidatus Desulfatibia profunda]MBL7180927.1 ATP-binding protein [Desulfobacterales bacterium]
MSEQKQFVGRKKELDEFQQFLAGARDGPGGKGAPVLLVMGDKGMGKTALLQAMAQEAAGQDHFVIVGEVDKRQSEFSEQIYPLIALLLAEKKLRPGAGRFWLKLGLAGLGTALGLPFLSELGGILKGVRDHHAATGSSLTTLAEILQSALSEVNGKLQEPQNLVVILDPEKESPPDLIPLLRNLERLGMPDKMRFVIAQRHKDALKTAFDVREIDRLCAEPMILGKMHRQEGQEFIETFDPGIRLKGPAQELFWKRYNGWPLLMKLALEEIEKAGGEINEQFIRSLPADIAGFWKQRFQDIRETESQIFVQTVCLLPHPYPKDRLAKFANLDPDQMHKAWNDKLVWCMLDKQDYEETLTEQSWKKCSAPRHETAREYVLERLEEDASLKQKRFSTIVSHYRDQIGEDLESAGVDKDALVYLLVYLAGSEDWDNFLSEVMRLTEVKLRYGLLDSLIANLTIALKISELSENNEYIAKLSGNLGIVYRIRGDLDGAEAMYKKSPEFDEEMGNKEGMAIDYGNLGNVYLTRDDLDNAEAMYKQSLEIDEAIGRKKGMADQYANLGIVYEIRSDLDDAEAMWEKSLELYEVIGAKHMIERVKGWLEDLRKR